MEKRYESEVAVFKNDREMVPYLTTTSNID